MRAKIKEISIRLIYFIIGFVIGYLLVEKFKK